MSGRSISFLGRVKYLGVTVDEGMFFGSHVKHALRTKSTFMSLITLSRTSNG